LYLGYFLRTTSFYHGFPFLAIENPPIFLKTFPQFLVAVSWSRELSRRTKEPFRFQDGSAILAKADNGKDERRQFLGVRSSVWLGGVLRAKNCPTSRHFNTSFEASVEAEASASSLGFYQSYFERAQLQ